MSRDQGAATGTTPYNPTRCTCGHLSSLHTLPASGGRGACSSWDCTCRRFTEAPDIDPSFNPAYRVARCGQQSAHGRHVVEHGPDQPRNCPGTGGDA